MILSKDFFRGEIIDGVYVLAKLKQIWAVNLDLLSVFEEFCRERRIRFFIGFGTLLGAFRHQGFVPWDDDVDILMPRADFERLKLLWREFDYPYFLQNELSEPDFWYKGMMKLRRSDTTCLTELCYKKQSMNQGIGLEIMPLDCVPDIASLRRQQEHAVGRLQRLLWAKNYDSCFSRQGGNKNPILSDEEWAWWKNESAKYDLRELQQEFLQTCRKYDGEEGQKLAIFTGYNQHDAYQLLVREWFADSVNMEFCGLTLPAPIGFWECLVDFYGRGFISFVPAAEQRPHHAALWDVETPYHVWQDRIENFCQWGEKKLCIFGTGSMAETFLQEMGDRLPKNMCFIDNNSKMQGKTFHDSPVYAPDKLLSFADRHVIICNSYYREIGNQLEDMGISQYYVWVDDNRALFSLAENNDSVMQDNKEYNIAGIFVRQHVLTGDLLKKIKEAKARCEYMLAFVEKDNLEMLGILKAITYVNRVVLVQENNKSEFKKFFCEEMWDLDG